LARVASMTRRRSQVVAAVMATAMLLTGCTANNPPAPDGSASFGPGSDGVGDSLYPTFGNGGYDVGHYDLDVRYNPGTKILTGTAVISATATANLDRFDLDLHGLTVASATVDGADARPRRTGDELVLTPANHLPTGQKFSVTVHYSGTPTPYTEPGTGTDGFLTTADGAIAIGEPEVAASWYPVNDHPRDKATYTIKVAAPDGLQVLSNGVLANTTSAGGYTTTTWSVTSPMASYLATIVIGHYRMQQGTADGKPVLSAVATSLPTDIDAQIHRTPEIIEFLATQFGPYPFDAMGGIVINDSRIRFALENQTRPIYSRSFFSAGADSTWVIAHELAHQWYGDSVSVNSWSDIWLNEGFATYAEWLWKAHEGGPSVRDSFERTYDNASDEIWRNPPGNPTKETVFGDSVYDRGAMTLQALRSQVGDDTFFRIIKDWAAQRQYGNGDTEQFVALAEQDSGQQLDTLFQAWLYGTTKPSEPPR
jgi:aminopeptidase N